MKKQLVLKSFILCSLCVFTLLSVFSPTFALVKGGKHDLSLGGGGGDGRPGGAFLMKTSQVCIFCHTPHNANSDVRGDTKIDIGSNTYDIGTGNRILLWNRALANLGAAASYSAYKSSSMNASMSQVRIYSLLCLSCHDGVSAMNVLLNQPIKALFDSNGNVDPTGDTQMGNKDLGINIGERDDISSGADNEVINLSNDHPVSIDYTTSLATADDGLVPPTSFVNSTDGVVYQDSSVIGNSIGLIRLFPSVVTGENTSIECSTCHDIHATPLDSLGTVPFLAVSNKGSAMCLACHRK
jgi:hypothetical protein